MTTNCRRPSQKIVILLCFMPNLLCSRAYQRGEVERVTAIMRQGDGYGYTLVIWILETLLGMISRRRGKERAGMPFAMVVGGSWCEECEATGHV